MSAQAAIPDDHAAPQRSRLRLSLIWLVLLVFLAAGAAYGAVLESFAPGTGSSLALLPPENATGNFTKTGNCTKIVQRVPARLRLRTQPDTRARLVPGLSVTVTIDTRQAVTPSDSGS